MRLALLLPTLCTLGVRATRPGYPPSLKPGCLAADPNNTDLFCPGDLGYGCFKIPTILNTAKGTLLAMIEARKYSCDDHGFVDLHMRRSFDGGKTWTPSQLMYSNSSEREWTTVGDGNWVQDASTGTVWLFHTRNNSRMFLSHSLDDGASWSEPRAVSSLQHDPHGAGTGHAGGIVLSSGPSKGRLIVPVYSGGPYIVFSDDHGASWQTGAAVPGESYLGGQNAQEWTLAETGAYTDDGTPILLASVRNSPNLPAGLTGKGYRLQSLSRDGGQTWGASWEATQLPEPIRGCEGSLVYHPGTRKLYFSHPDPALDLFRNRLKVWTSSNLGATWEEHAVVWRKAAGYSSLTVLADGNLGVFYDRNNHSMAIFEAQSVSWTTVAP